MEKDPHLLIEGMIIAGYAIGSNPMAYIYIRGEFYFGAMVLEKALAEAREKGFLGKNILGSGFDFDITVARGAGAYICGEETGLIESIEGHRGQPRVKPPFPAVIGAFGGPTVVQNVETLTCVPLIVKNGAEWFKSFGTPKNTGPKLYCVSGTIKKPGVYEFPMGINLKELINVHCGGVPDGRKLKAIPGGASEPMHARRDRHPAQLRRADESGLDARVGRHHRARRFRLHRRRCVASREILRARVVRAMHAVP
jgi:NADH-quinone oxidoreductase subunit F